MFYQIFLSPQVKRRAIITYKHVSYIRVALQVAEPLKTLDPRKLRNIRKVSKPHRMIPQCALPQPAK